MKKFKHFTIDEDLAVKLEKEKNASSIVNELLKDYYNSNNGLKKQELKNKLIQLEADKKKITQNMEIIKKQIKTIEREEKRLNKTFKNIPKEIMDDFRFFEKMNLESCLKRYSQVWSRKWDIPWTEIKHAFCELRGIKEDAQ